MLGERIKISYRITLEGIDIANVHISFCSYGCKNWNIVMLQSTRIKIFRFVKITLTPLSKYAEGG